MIAIDRYSLKSAVNHTRFAYLTNLAIRARLVVVLAVSLMFLASGLNTAWTAEKPNVIFVLTDDQGYGDLSCHGNPVLKTPNLDQLYQQSIRFTDFHVAPMCSPTRGELLTGIDAFRNGATFVCQGRSLPRRELPTMADIFKENGYATGHFGKWHLGDSYPFRPHDRGFDVSIHNKAWGIRSLAEHWQNDAFDDRYWRNNELQQFPGYNTDVFFDEAMAWMERQEEPFFCFIPTTAAHGPFNVADKYREPYSSLDAPLPSFFGMIANIDENMGRLDNFLKENDLRENTILIFMTDNGTVVGHRLYNAGMRGHKRTDWDGGHRVPFFLRWPAGDLGSPREIATLSHSTDVLPTLMELCDLKTGKKTEFDGRSLVPLIEDPTNASQFKDRMLVVQYRAKFVKWQGAVLWNKWRLVHGDQLYNIAEDPDQSDNVYDQHPDIVEAMRTHYENWCQETKPIMGQTNYMILETQHEPVTWLSSCNWTGSYCDNWGNLASGNRFGHWNLEVETPGQYEVKLYLFHPDSVTPLNQSLRNVPARPVSQARLIVDGKSTTVDTWQDDTHAVFSVVFEKGDKVKLEGQFLDENGKKLFGSVYTFLELKE